MLIIQYRINSSQNDTILIFRHKISQKSRDYSVLGALFGLPALSMPMGFGHHSLPLGITITGKPFDENTLLQIGILFQRETGWHQMHPNVNHKIKESQLQQIKFVIVHIKSGCRANPHKTHTMVLVKN